jgi:hypothetical protein
MYAGGIQKILDADKTNIDEIGALMLGVEYVRKTS